MQRDANAAGKGVALGGRVPLHELRELVDERLAHGGHALVVGARERDREVVGDEDAVARDDGGLGVELAPQRCGDLERLHPALEGLRERATDDAFQPSLEAVEKPHVAPSLGLRTLRC